MKVFISSMITGYEAERDAAEAAITVLGHQAVRAEQFTAFAATPQRACLAGVRDAGVVVLILGDRYGATQPLDCRRRTRSIARRESEYRCSSSWRMVQIQSRPNAHSSTRCRHGQPGTSARLSVHPPSCRER